MANNYLQFSTLIPDLNLSEKKWFDHVQGAIGAFVDDELSLDSAKDRMKFSSKFGAEALEIATGMELDDGLGFDMSLGDDKDIWIRAEENGDPEQVATFIQFFLKKFRPNTSHCFSWAEWCDKLRVNEFGGGSVLITTEWMEWVNDTYLDDLGRAYETAKKKNRDCSKEVLLSRLKR